MKTREIKLTQGMVARVDADDYDWLIQHKWYAHRSNRTKWYAARGDNIAGTLVTVRMHREIAQPPEGFVVDHINGDTLDNRRANLRVCTYSENSLNRRSTPFGTSNYRGVYWREGKGRWAAQIRYERKKYHLGYYKNEDEAARAYDEKAKELLGKYARLNFE